MIYREGDGKIQTTTNPDTPEAGEALAESTRPGQATSTPFPCVLVEAWCCLPLYKWILKGSGPHW